MSITQNPPRDAILCLIVGPAVLLCLAVLGGWMPWL